MRRTLIKAVREMNVIAVDPMNDNCESLASLYNAPGVRQPPKEKTLKMKKGMVIPLNFRVE